MMISRPQRHAYVNLVDDDPIISIELPAGHTRSLVVSEYGEGLMLLIDVEGESPTRVIAQLLPEDAERLRNFLIR